MNPFELIRLMIDAPRDWHRISNAVKSKNFFITQRRMAINFPLQANMLQGLRVVPHTVMDFWQDFLSKQYKKIPGWMYAKGVKQNEKQKERKIKVSKETITRYCKLHNIERKTVDDALEFFPDEMENELKEFDKTTK